VRPGETEYAPWAKHYVEGVEGTDPLEILRKNTPEYLALISSLDGDFRYAPGKWTVKQVVGHVTDTERIFAYRLLCVARGDQTHFPGFEQDDYLACAEFHNRTLADLVAEFEAVRQASILLIQGLSADSWSRRGTVGGYSVTPRGIAFQLAGHERHHFRILRDSCA
jgi:uncharacterized damage-inducible protein DinB